MDRIMNISKWTKEDLIQALRRRGYLDSGQDIITSKFNEVSNHRVVFDIAFYDMAMGGIEHGKVYVFIDDSGEVVADF